MVKRKQVIRRSRAARFWAALERSGSWAGWSSQVPAAGLVPF